jgi:hypothetical protein
MKRVLLLTIVCTVALTAGAESASPRKRGAANPERILTNQTALEQDEFKSCDVAVRDFVQGRKEATALPVKEVKVDGLRMTLNFVHPYGESGDTPPNLGFTRAESIEERRKALNEAKQRIRTLEEAAKTGNVWYVIALTRDTSDGLDGRRSPASMQSEAAPGSASAVVMASIENRCVTIANFATVAPETLGDDLRRLLGEKGREASPTDMPATPPPS